LPQQVTQSDQQNNGNNRVKRSHKNLKQCHDPPPSELI
jgi:hypothetical protein